MLKLSRRTEPEWIELVGGAAVHALPPSSVLVYMARARAEALLADLVSAGEAVTKAGGFISGGFDTQSEDGKAGLTHMLFVVSLAELAIVDWRGVGDVDGKPLKFDASLVVHLLADSTASDLFQRRYLTPIHEVVDEGNVSRPLPNGNSGRAGAAPTVKAAKRRAPRAPRHG